MEEMLVDLQKIENNQKLNLLNDDFNKDMTRIMDPVDISDDYKDDYKYEGDYYNDEEGAIDKFKNKIALILRKRKLYL